MDAYEWCAASYGWGPAQLERELTGEQLAAYLEHGGARAAAEHRNAIEAQRLGTVFAYEAKLYQRWLSRQRLPQPGATAGSTGRGLAGAELEYVLTAMLATNPDIVQVRVH